MLNLGIRYLNGWSMATHPSNRQIPEWPPHPDRVFMALAAAHFETDGDAAEREVLEWIESQPDPPEVVASPARNRSNLSCYVPPNDMGPPDPTSHKNGKLVTSIRTDELTAANLKRWLKEIRKIKKTSVVSRAFDFLELRDRVDTALIEDPTPDLRRLLTDTASELARELGTIDWKEFAQEALSVLPQYRALNLKERSFPVAVPDCDQVFLVWPDASPNDIQKSALQSLCEKVTRIGHSASFTQMWVAEGELPINDSRYQRQLPIPTGRLRLRIPGRGRLADLESRYNRGEIEDYAEMKRRVEVVGLKLVERKKRKAALHDRFGDRVPESRRPEPALWAGYDGPSDEKLAPKVPSSRFSSLIVLKQTEGRRFGLESTQQLTQALRATAMKFSAVQPVPEWVSGHQPNGEPAKREFGHMAFVPLPHVGSRHADGHLLGMALVPPRDISRTDLANALHSLLYDEVTGMTVRVKLNLGPAGSCILEAADGTEGRAALDPTTWSRPSKRWATVTPIALDRHAKSDDHWAEVAKTIELACARIGLPKPADVIPAPVSMFLGSPPSREMPRMSRKSGERHIQQTHAILTFNEKVAGPVLLGAGRYRGYGMCRPLDGKNE